MGLWARPVQLSGSAAGVPQCGAHDRPRGECVHDYAFWIWRAGGVGQLQPDVGTAELVVWPLQILSWSMRPDQTVPMSSSLNLAFPSLRGTQGFSGGICSFEEKCRIACFAPRPWSAGSFLTGGMKSPSRKPALGCQRRSNFDGEAVCAAPTSLTQSPYAAGGARHIISLPRLQVRAV